MMRKISKDSAIGRAVQAMSQQPWFQRVVGPKLIPPLDRLLHRLTGGRVLLGAMILDSLLLTTTGRRSGQPRTVPVAYFWVDGARVVVGTNFGRDGHPAWALNLAATPAARIEEAGAVTEVTAVKLAGEERAHAWQEVVAQWPPFRTYEDTMGQREPFVFRLEQAAG